MPEEDKLAALDEDDLEPYAVTGLGGWTSGWLGISTYGQTTHGFATMTLGAVDDPVARVWWLAPDGDAHEGLRLRYDPHRHRVDLFACVSEELSWEATIEVSPDLAERCAVPSQIPEIYPDELFTEMATAYADIFQILSITEAQELPWDHDALPGPDPDAIWRPVDLGDGLGPFVVRHTVPTKTRPCLHSLHRAVSPDGPGYFADLGRTSLFMSESGVCTPVFPWMADDYRKGEKIEFEDVHQPVRDELRHMIRFHLGPSPIT